MDEDAVANTLGKTVLIILTFTILLIILSKFRINLFTYVNLTARNVIVKARMRRCTERHE